MTCPKISLEKFEPRVPEFDISGVRGIEANIATQQHNHYGSSLRVGNCRSDLQKVYIATQSSTSILINELAAGDIANFTGHPNRLPSDKVGTPKNAPIVCNRLQTPRLQTVANVPPTHSAIDVKVAGKIFKIGLAISNHSSMNCACPGTHRLAVYVHALG